MPEKVLGDWSLLLEVTFLSISFGRKYFQCAVLVSSHQRAGNWESGAPADSEWLL